MKTSPAAITDIAIWEWFHTRRDIDIRPLSSCGLVAPRRAIRPAEAGPRTNEQASRIGRSSIRYGLPCCFPTGRTLERKTRASHGNDDQSMSGSPSIHSPDMSETTTTNRTAAPTRTERTSAGRARAEATSDLAVVAMSPPSARLGTDRTLQLDTFSRGFGSLKASYPHRKE